MHKRVLYDRGIRYDPSYHTHHDKIELKINSTCTQPYHCLPITLGAILIYCLRGKYITSYASISAGTPCVGVIHTINRHSSGVIIIDFKRGDIISSQQYSISNRQRNCQNYQSNDSYKKLELLTKIPAQKETISFEGCARSL